MTTSELLIKLKELGVRLWVDDKQLRYDAPTGAITPQVRDAMISHKADIIELLKKQTAANPSKSIQRFKRDGNLPLSFAQQRLWILEQIEGDLTAYNMPSVRELQGALNIEALRQALETIVERHETLRTTFSTVDDEPVQVIHQNSRFELPLEDLSFLESGEQEVELAKRSHLEAERAFDLTADRMLRARLLRLAEDKHALLLTMHHIASDGWSNGVLLRELEHLYNTCCNGVAADLPELPVQYVDYAVWQRTKLSGKRLVQLLAYWREQLDGVAVLNLPTDHPRPAVLTYEGSRYDIELNPSLVEQLKSISRSTGTTLNMLLLAAFQTLLMRYSGQDDIATGTPIAGRDDEDLEHQIGFFVNTLVIRTDFSNDPTFRELLGRVRDASLGAYDHGELPFEKLVEELQPNRQPNLNPFFQALFQLFHVSTDLKLSGLDVVQLPSSSKRVHFDLEMTLLEYPNHILGTIRYSTDLFEHASIERMAGHFAALLEGVLADVDQKISALPLLAAPEKQQLLVEWNDTKTDYPRDKCIHELFEAQVDKAPDAIAVVFEEERLTYKELNRRANQLANHLTGLGVGAEVLVGICLERSVEMLVGMLGILKAGGAYVPLDPHFPVKRLEMIMEDAALEIIVTQQSLSSLLDKFEGKRVLFDALSESSARELPEHSSTPAQPAYVIYTSGSTGRPKGVVLEHRSVVNFLYAMHERPGISETDVLLAVTTISFDISVLELFLPLLFGAQVVIASDEVRLDGGRLARLIRESGATLFQATPATWKLLLESGWDGSKQLKALVGGEALTMNLAKQLHGSCRELWNLYGPTETTVWSLAQRIEDPENITIGTPIGNTQVYVVDKNNQLVPIGVSGELLIGGDGLARGYWQREELTAERFIVNPFDKSGATRLYRTGDLVRWRSDQQIEFLGRMDNQVKVRGFRIELGEIEAALAGIDSIKECAVIVREDKSEDKRLVAYYEVKPEEAVEVDSLRKALRDRLPDYMVPQFFVKLDDWPLTANRKIDQNRLPKPDSSDIGLGEQHILPSTKTEKALVKICQKLIGIETISINTNFFDIGGHSLLAVQLISKIRETLDAEVAFMSLINHTLQEIAAKIDGVEGLGDAPASSSIAGEDAELFHFGTEQALYGILHKPIQSHKSLGAVLLCNPTYAEAINAHWACRRLAIQLSELGFYVLRFDYYGTGNSLGDAHEGGVERWIEDIQVAAEELCKRSGFESISLVGLRFGATLAALSRLTNIDKLVLWEPVIDGAAYLSELQAKHRKLLSQLNAFRKNSAKEVDGELFGFFLSKEERSLLLKTHLNEGDCLVRSNWASLVTSVQPSMINKSTEEFLVKNTAIECCYIDDSSPRIEEAMDLSRYFPGKGLKIVIDKLKEDK